METIPVAAFIILTLVSSIYLLYIPRNHPGSSVTDNTLIFAPLEEGEDYNLRSYLDEEAKAGWLLGPYVAVAKNFILELVELDLVWLKGIYKGDEEFKPKAFGMTLLPILVPFVVGLLLAICTPFVGFWFCYCRLCGKCGGRLTMQKAEDQEKKWGLVNFIALVVCCVMLTVAAGAIWTVGQRMPDVGEHIVNVASHTVTDVIIFLDNLFQDLMHVAVDDVHFAASYMSGQLDTMSDHIMEQFNQDTASQWDAILSALTTLGLATISLNNGLAAISTTESDINTLDTTLQGELTTIRTKLDDIYSDCTGHVSSPDCSGFLQGSDITPVDFSLSLDMSAPNSLLTSAQSVDTSALSTSVTAAMSTMTTTIDTNTVVLRDLSTEVLSNITVHVSPLLEEVDVAFHDAAKELETVRDTVTEYTDLMDPYLVKVTISFMVLSGLVLLILIFDITGIVFGITNCNASSADRRKSLGHCGGHLIMASVGFSFIWVFLYLFTGVILMLIGSVLTIICQPVRDLTIFSKVLDDPALWDGEYKLGSMLLDNGTIPLTISGILEDCKANKAAYSALQIKHRVDIESLVNIEEQLPDLSPLISQVQAALSGIELLSSADKTALSNMQSSHSGTSVDVNTLIGAHTTLLTSIDFASTITTLDGLADLMDVPPTTAIAVDIRDVADNDLTNVQTGTRQSLITKISDMETHLTTVSDAIIDILASLNTLNTEVALYETYLQNDGADTIEASTEAFIARIVSLAQQTLSHVHSRLAHDIASCALVWDIYDGATGLLCVYFLDAFNGLWLSMVLVGVFLIPNIWFGVRLTKYFRRPVDITEYRRNMHITADEMNTIVERYETAPVSRKRVLIGPVQPRPIDAQYYRK